MNSDNLIKQSSNVPLERPRVIGCGILHKEVEFLIQKNDWPLDTCFLDSTLHNNLSLLSESLEKAIIEGVRQGYQEGYLRKSIVQDPLNRTNTGDNTPCILHLTSVEGDTLKISFTAKGGGSENMSRLKMLTPADGVEGVKQFVIDTVKEAHASVCPPSIVGVGIGGTFEKAALLAKKALLRDIGSVHEDPFYKNLEEELFLAINNLKIGPMGLGGDTTCLDVFIKTFENL